MSAQLATIENRTPATRDDVSTQSLVFDPDAINNMMRLAEMMAKSVVTIPKHLAGNPSDCMAIVLQAAQWKMNPYSVAQATHLVSGTLGYEAKLVNAVVQNSGAIRGRFHYEYRGEGAKVECRVGAIPAGETDIVWGEWLSAADVTTKNSPLWKTNPRQQLGYLQVKNWARQYTPGALLGVYSVDELRDSEPRNMGQAQTVNDDPPAASRTESVKSKLKSKTKASSKPEPQAALEPVLTAISAAQDLEALKAAGEQAKPLQGEDREAALAAYKQRQSELKAAAEQPSAIVNELAAVASADSADILTDIRDWSKDAELSDADLGTLNAAIDARLAEIG
ncbi:MAG: recombinase RecT [Chromatiaceae bacterium]|nr:recombinase RecT [Chromatiaceae bacterium]